MRSACAKIVYSMLKSWGLCKDTCEQVLGRILRAAFNPQLVHQIGTDSSTTRGMVSTHFVFKITTVFQHLYPTSTGLITKTVSYI